MTYKVMGLMSGSSLDGLDIVFVHIVESSGKWRYEVKAADCLSYNKEWRDRLRDAPVLSAGAYCQLHTDYGHYIARQIKTFTAKYDLHMQMDLISSHGHTVFHCPDKKMTAQLGDGAAIAAEMEVAVVSDLRNMDVAFGGQGAPLVPMGEQLLYPDYDFFLNLGGIANISYHDGENVTAYDVCPANRVLNALAEKEGKPYDDAGNIARSGTISKELLQELNAQEYYKQKPPKSLANEFGAVTLRAIIEKMGLSVADSLRTYTEHIAEQIENSLEQLLVDKNPLTGEYKMLVTGGGAYNRFLIHRLKQKAQMFGVELEVPDEQTINYKEAIIMALLGALRWRENNTTLTSVTGAKRASIGGALWMGQEGW